MDMANDEFGNCACLGFEGLPIDWMADNGMANPDVGAAYGGNCGEYNYVDDSILFTDDCTNPDAAASC